MKIKNIKNYRKFYKEEVRDLPTRDENFIGNFLLENGKKKFGWFDIYHGDKEGYGKAENGIENFLQSFLDMARDGQAVYEFLQNAVDAGSTHYTMVWGKDEEDGNYYLMVANNGDMFSLNSVRSILNVGSSTKTADSNTIGKFGIGFKLAHRLVGKDNGLEELLHENSGPLLFSWQNYEIEQLAKGTIPEPTDMDIISIGDNQYHANDLSPWLFKILITCFPSLPENGQVHDLPKMANGHPSTVPPFSSEEYDTLSRWVKKHTHILNKETYQTGAIFFIKLGEGKESELAEENLHEGVKFALAILNETVDEADKKKNVLRTVQLNDAEPITLPELEYVKINISRSEEQDNYAYIRFGAESYEELTIEQLNKVKQESDIEVLFGFRPYHKIDKYFKGAPNFYLYFPLSEEVHNFNYILHSNAFYKGSSRTFLHKGSGKEDGINERLLKVIVEKIELEFIRLTSSDNLADRRKFLDFYAALLSSSQSANNERKWIEEPYVNRITTLLRKYIPTRIDQHSDTFLVSNDPGRVFIKDTNIDIDIVGWELKGVKWFYWGEGSDLQLKLNATTKLDIKKYSIQNLLAESSALTGQINSWIGSDQRKMATILKEIPVEPSVLNKLQRDNLFLINLFLFQEDEVHSIESFKNVDDKGYFISRNKLVDIRDVLGKLGLLYSINDVEEFTKSYLPYFGGTSQLSSYEILTNRFSSAVTNENLNKLTDEEKNRVFNAFRTFNDNPGQRMGSLKIFANKKGEYLMLQHLLAETKKKWLVPYVIEKDFGALVRTYLVKEDKDLYKAIVHPFWSSIAATVCKDPKNATTVLIDIESLYEQSDWTDKSINLIDEKSGLFFKSEFIVSDEIFFDVDLKNLSQNNYNQIQNALYRFQDIVIPDQFFLSHLETAPFDFGSIDLELDILEVEIELEDINALLLLDKEINGDFFENHAILNDGGRFFITKQLEQIHTQNKKLLKYIDVYLPGKYIMIPEKFEKFKDRIGLFHPVLVNHIIEDFQEEDNMVQEIELIEAILDEGLNDQRLLFEKLTYLDLDASWKEENQNQVYLRFANSLLSVESDDLSIEDIHHKLRIIGDGTDLIIGEIHNAEDKIHIPFNGKDIEISQSQLLDLEEKDSISIVEEFSIEAVRRELISGTISEKLFKRNSTGVTDELVELFNGKVADNQITNAHQLVFLLFSGKYEKCDLENYKVKSFDDKFYGLGGNMIFYDQGNEAFFNPAYILHKEYEELQSILGVSDLEQVFYGVDEEDIFMPKFLFIPGADPNILKKSTEIIPMLEYLYQYWNLLGPQLRTPKPSEEWGKILGFDPKLHLIGELLIKDEILPEEVLTWVNDEILKIVFLSAIGLSTENSDIMKIRQWLCGKNEESAAFKDASLYSLALLFNTIKGLSGEFQSIKDRNVLFVRDTPQIQFIEEIYRIHQEKSSSEYIPDIVHFEKNTFSIVKAEKPRRIEEELMDLLHLDLENKLNFLFSREHIVKQSLTKLWNYDELKLEEEFLIPDEYIEHDEPFYNSWKSIYKTRLFKVDHLNFNVFYEEELIGTIERGEFYFDDKGKEWKDIYYKRTLSLENLSKCLGEGELSKSLGEMIEDKDTMLRNLYNVMNAAGKDDISDSNLRALKIAMQQENIIHERQSYADNMRAVTKYSSEWFITFLNYLATFESQQYNIQQKSIFFQEISHYIVNGTISDKFFLLKAANSLIPVNIEEFNEFALEVIFKDKSREKIMVEGVSKKGQDVLIYCRSTLSSDTIAKLGNVLSLKISFTPRLDLSKVLYNAFVNVNNITEWDEIEDALPALNYIYGPPGTGKTTTICRKIAEAVEENHNLRVLLLTPTNKAADVVAKKLVKDHKKVSVIRIGKPTDGELEDEEIYKDSISAVDIDSTHVIASTVHRIPYFKAESDDMGVDLKFFELEDHWDYIIFDESSMISLPYMVFCIQAIKRRNPCVEIIIAGDPQQIPPVSALSDADMESLDIDEENIYKMMKVNSFVDSEVQIRGCDSMDQLKKQYRSLPEIGQLFSELAYGSELEHHRKKINNLPRPLPLKFKAIFDQAVNFVNIPLDEDNSILAIGKLFYSSYHLHSAIFIAELVKYLDNCLEDGEVWTIGLIAPYKAQAALMNRIITSYHLSDRVKISCDTVHGFQGDECDMVFFVANPSRSWYTGDPRSLLSKKYIYNVAISRAKDYLIVLHPFKKITGNTFINRIAGSYESNFGANQIKDYRKIEKVIFGDSDFIEHNSYITGHDSINVFGQTDIKYFVKSSDQAIDIVLKT